MLIHRVSKMNLILMGPRCEGTQAALLVQRFGIAYLYRRYVSRELQQKTELGLKPKAIWTLGN